MHDLIIHTKSKELLQWLMPKAEQFPRAHRYTLTHRMMSKALNVHDGLITANSRGGSSRLEVLLSVDSNLQQLKSYLGIAHSWRWLSDGQYRHISKIVAELGRLLGGWIKQTQSSGSQR